MVTPHGHRIDQCFSLLHNTRVQGTLDPEPDSGGSSLSVTFEVDMALNNAIVEEAQAVEVPVSRVYYAVDTDANFSMPLDWGALVPLWFLGASLDVQPRVVIACPDRNKLDWGLSAPFGRAIRQAAERLNRRIVLIASADLGHAHDAKGPYGYDVASQEFDMALRDAVQAQDLGRLLEFDRAWLKRAATDAYGQVLNLYGAIQGTTLRGELLSYEVPTYFGMMCVAYAPAEEGS